MGNLNAVVFGLALVALLPGAGSAQPVRQMLNGLRAEQGLEPVVSSPRLEEAAKRHALDMARRGFFGHEGSDGSDVMARARRQGYGACTIAENLAQGQNTLTEVLGAWVQSPGHRANLLHPNIREYGLVRAPGDIWVLVLGADGC